MGKAILANTFLLDGKSNNVSKEHWLGLGTQGSKESV